MNAREYRIENLLRKRREEESYAIASSIALS